MNRFLPLTLVILILAAIPAGCGRQADPDGGHASELAPLAEMPAEVQAAPVTVREAYQFAVANPDVLRQLPCYCGCGAMGHVSNYSCYIQEGAADGEPAFDNHALGCTICVDITQDAMRLLDEGQSLAQIANYVDATYGRFGPPTPLEGGRP